MKNNRALAARVKSQGLNSDGLWQQQGFFQQCHLGQGTLGTVSPAIKMVNDNKGTYLSGLLSRLSLKKSV